MKPFPSFTFPVPRGKERYERLLQLYAIAQRMSAFGIRVDQLRTKYHLQQARKRAAFYTEMFLNETGLSKADMGKAEAGQTKNIRNWFWELHKAPVLSKAKKTGRPQFNTPTLLAYATDFKDKPYSRAAAALMALRSAQTASRFAEAYLAVSTRYSGRIHFGFNPSGTKGERWSSAKRFSWTDENGVKQEYSLNAQNVPNKEPTFEFESGRPTRLAYSLRDCFIADPGCVIGKADYDQQELRLIAYTAGVKKLIDWIERGTDPHMENAKVLFKEYKLPANAKKSKKAELGTLQDLINRCREAAKPAQYAISYQDVTESFNKQKPKYPDLYKTIVKQFPDLPERLLYEVIVPRFFELHPEIKQWQFATRRSLEELGYVQLRATGTLLYLPNTARGRNQALNFQMQSGGGALINRAIIEIDKGCSWQPNGSAILLNVHDELDVQAPFHDMQRVKDLVESNMGASMQIGETFTGIPAAWDPGWNWGDTIAYKDFLVNNFLNSED